jgi:hypothetical protein
VRDGMNSVDYVFVLILVFAIGMGLGGLAVVLALFS